MDNLLIAERNIRTIEKLKRRRLSDEFKMTDFGEATLFLGMRLAYNLECGDLNLKLFPETAVTKTLEKFGMTESNSTKNSVSRVAGQPKCIKCSTFARICATRSATWEESSNSRRKIIGRH